MSPAKATNVPDKMENQMQEEGVRDTSLKANWRILAMTLYMGTALFEYGFDKGAIAGFQSMPGFLQVFGYRNNAGEWAIEVSSPFSPQHFARACVKTITDRTSANDQFLHDSGLLYWRTYYWTD